MVTDNVVLSNDGGRWSVSLDERAPRGRVPGPRREPVPVPAR